MTSVPYPTFRTIFPVAENMRAVAAVGRCRIHPLQMEDHEKNATTLLTNPTDTTTDETKALFRAIVEKNIQQANVESDSNITEEAEAKTLRKKFMKQGVAMAQSFLEDHLQLDPSIIDIEIVLQADDIVSTDGCLASCFLDAGCERIVMDLNSNNSRNDLDVSLLLDAAKIPKERFMGHLEFATTESNDTNDLDELIRVSKGWMESIQPYCSSISIDCSGLLDRSDAFLDKLMDLGTAQMAVVAMVEATTLSEGSVCSLCGQATKQGFGSTVSIIDPSPQTLGSYFVQCCKTDRPDGLFTTVVCTRNGEALGLVYSSKESIIASLECGRAVYYSRSRNSLWRKGDTSGHYQTLHRIDVDCDGDALRFTVTQRGDDEAAFCHLNTLTCWGKPHGLRHLEETLQERLKSAPEGSYTKRLFDDTELLRDKLVEEAQELAEADTQQHVAEELADLLYFALTRAAKAGVSIDDAVAELDKRSRKVTRRKGDSKAFRIAAGKEILDKTQPPSKE